MTEKAENSKTNYFRKNNLKSFMGGNLLASDKVMKQMKLVLLLVFLAIIMITNRYYSEKVIKQIETVQESIKELKTEATTYETELMHMNKPSEITNKVKERGIDLIEPQEPAKKIKVKKLDQE